MDAKNVRRISSINKEIFSRQTSKFLLKCILENDREPWDKWRKAFFECQTQNYKEDFKSEEDLRQIELRLAASDIDGFDLSAWKGFFTLVISHQNNSKEEDLKKVKSILNKQGRSRCFNETDNEKSLREDFERIKESFLNQDKDLWESSIQDFFFLLNKEFPKTFKTESDLKLIELSLDIKESGALYHCWKFPFEVSISISCNVNFDESEFCGKAKFKFDDELKALFFNTKFYERANFSGFNSVRGFEIEALYSFFLDGVCFSGVKFSPDTKFLDCSFYGLEKVPTKDDVLQHKKDYSKSNTFYNNDIVFKDSSFAGFVDFSGSVFLTNADFRSAKFSSDVSFENAGFYESKAMFNNATFEGKCYAPQKSIQI